MKFHVPNEPLIRRRFYEKKVHLWVCVYVAMCVVFKQVFIKTHDSESQGQEEVQQRNH